MTDQKTMTWEAFLQIDAELGSCSSEEELELRAAVYGIDLDGDQVVKTFIYNNVLKYGMAPEDCEVFDHEWMLKGCPTRDEWDQMWECKTLEEAQPWVEKFDIYNAKTMLENVRACGHMPTDRRYFMADINSRLERASALN